ncbi:MAG: histidyl-tRNA synthase [Bacteroides sp. SM23_62_1]|nr:MAG: histidyl-tRNA synthase [Bacteroides sp. SM23_62_1]
MQKPSVPKGTRDFSPEAMVRRKFIFETIEDVFQLFGYLPLETPAMENLSSLLGKYGEEGDKLLFKVLNSGNYLSDIPVRQINPENAGKLALRICEKGLRYDLTVPFARYVVQHRNDLTFPFKRYQIQPVWRADKPQKGRYREFYQCDVDIIGSNSLLNEAELIQVIDDVFTRLGMNVLIKINNRKVLSGIAEIMGLSGMFNTLTVILDKLDRIGIEGVMSELLSTGIKADAVEKLKPILKLKGSNSQKIDKLEKILYGSGTGQQGLKEVDTLFRILGNISCRSEILWDIPLARGLDYYTGTIIEVIALDDRIGSVCGGGRYDDLAGIFGMPDISGVGVSFGAERIFDVMSKLNLFPEGAVTGTKVLFVNLGAKEQNHILPLLSKIRGAGIRAEIYPDHAKLKKQMAFAHAKKIPFVALVGEDEISAGLITLRNMQTGEQKKVNLDELIGQFM